MKTISFGNFAKLFVFLLFLTFTACTEKDDPVPTPDQENPRDEVPDDSDDDDEQPDNDDDEQPDNDDEPDNDDGSDDDDEPDNDDDGNDAVVGIISTEDGDYKFANYLGADVENQPNEAGAYETVYYYGDDDAAKDDNEDGYIDGVITGIAFNASEAGVLEPGEYTYNVGSNDAGEFAFVMIFDHDDTYVVTGAQIAVVTTNNSDYYAITFEGEAAAAEIVDGEMNLISDPFDIAGQFLIPASLHNDTQPKGRVTKNFPISKINSSALQF